jgi:hypothetical protein
MINQAPISYIDSRNECNVYDDNGFLPLITAPMYSVIDEKNYETFLNHNIQTCIPRGIKTNLKSKYGLWISYSLNDFIDNFHNNKIELDQIEYALIDTANGNMFRLHNAIKIAKSIHKDKLVIMAGNVSSVEAFIELAKTGVDYIRIGIGGSSSCNTTSNTGVGQLDLEELIIRCYTAKIQLENVGTCGENFNYKWYSRHSNTEWLKYEHIINFISNKDCLQIANVKIVADGISSYVKGCQTKYGFNDNGYAAINKLLYTGADLVMVGKLFAQCMESAGEKGILDRLSNTYISLSKLKNKISESTNIYVKYSGMSTQTEQQNYKSCPHDTDSDNNCGYCYKTGKCLNIKPSEGSINWIPVRFNLVDWIYGDSTQDSYPYLMGWKNSLQSAMSYTNSKKLIDFKFNKND